MNMQGTINTDAPGRALHDIIGTGFGGGEEFLLLPAAAMLAALVLAAAVFSLAGKGKGRKGGKGGGE